MTHRVRRTWGRPFGLAVLLVGVGVTPLLWDGRYYFRGDTQVAYLGWWYHLGERVREGHLPLMEPLAWEAGNYVAEGQWGLFSPLTILIGVLASVVPDVVVFVTVLKIGLVVLGGLGTYVLVRSYGARDGLAVVAGLVVGLSGHSVSAEWPSWVNGQLGAALLPWVWWSSRRAMTGHNPAAALVLCYLTTAVGYVYCAMYAGAVLLGCLVDAALSRSRRGMLTVLGLVAFTTLVSVAVYLPGVLTAPVTMRDSRAVVGPGRFTTDLQGLFTGVLPTLRRNYLLWLLPAIVWLDLPRLRRSSRDLTGALVTTGVFLLWVLGPSAVGPLRWPLRVVPGLMVPLVVVLAVAASRTLPVRVPRTRLALSLTWVAAAAYLVVARDPHQLKAVALGAVLSFLTLGITAWSLGRGRAQVTVGVVLMSTLALFVVQHALHPVPGADDRNLPADATRYDGRLQSARGDVIVLGEAGVDIQRNPAIADHLLIGSAWYLDPHDVQNGYSTIRYRAFRDRFCRTVNGGTCARALAALLQTEASTGRRWADLLSVSTVVLYRPSFPKVDLGSPPPGWTVSERTPYTVVWTRDRPVPTAGGVVATSAGLTVESVSVTDTVVELRPTTVGAGGGTVTFSRLAWPGYTVEGAELVEPLGGMLVQVDVPPGAAGRTVVLRWEPPGWGVSLTALATALLAGSVWVAAWTVVARRPPRAGGRRGPWRSARLPSPRS